MVRTDMISGGKGLASAFLTVRTAPLTGLRSPVSQRDRDVAPGLTQNTG